MKLFILEILKLNILIFQNYLNLKFNFLLIIIIILKMLNPEENISFFPGLNSPNPVLNKYYEQLKFSGGITRAH